MYQIKKGIDFSIDPHQYAYKKNRCTADAILYVVHMALTHLENRDSYVRMHFLDFSSAFNTIIPQTLVHKLESVSQSVIFIYKARLKTTAVGQSAVQK